MHIEANTVIHRAGYSSNNIFKSVLEYTVYFRYHFPTKHVCKLCEISQSFVSNILESVRLPEHEANTAALQAWSLIG